MKTKLGTLKSTLALCGILAATAAYGQTVRVWDGGVLGTGTGIEFATNWVGDVLPAVGAGDLATWDGLVPGNLVITYNTGLGGWAGAPGMQFILTPNQTGSVSIVSQVPESANLSVGRFLTNDSATASLQFGDNTANRLSLVWRNPEAAPFLPRYFINNSTVPSVIHPNVRTIAGGGNPHTLVFGGSGDWIVNNYLRADNNVGTFVQKQDSGRMLWGGPTTAAFNSGINSPVVISGGTLVLTHHDVLGTQTITNDGALLEFDFGAGVGVLSGPIHGAGPVRVSSGTITLSSGASTFAGGVVLANTGTLVAGGAEGAATGPLGVGGPISFTGGALRFSGVNTFDYSPRFSPAAGQAYRIHTGGQTVTFATGLGGVGNTLAKEGPGTLTLTGTSSYDGLTTVNAGRLVFGGPKTGTGGITVANGAALGVTATGVQVTPAALTLGTTAGATLEFNNIASTTVAPLAAGALSTGGPVTVNVLGGAFAPGQSYPLLTWTSGAAPTANLGVLSGAAGNLSISGNTLYLNVTAIAFVWSGANNNSWDLTTPNNWLVAGNPAVFVSGGAALFDDTATGPTDVFLNAPVAPADVTVSSSARAYSIASSGANSIGGAGGLSKFGGSSLTLSGGANTYTGPTLIGGGVLSVGTLASGGAPSDIGASGSGAANLVLDGGALFYSGGDGFDVSVDRLFTLGTGGGTLNASGLSALNLNNSGAVGLSGLGARVLTLAGNNTGNNTLAASIGDSGGATSLFKSGAGLWIVTANNTYSGGTTISAGTLQVGAGGATGALGGGNIANNSALVFNRTGTLTNGIISGTGSVTVDGGGTVVLPGNNTYTGGTTINNGTLRVGVGGATGSLSSDTPIVNNGTIVFDSTGSFAKSGVISGTGNLVKRGTGLLKLIGANTFSGWTRIEAGATLQISEGNTGQYASSVITNEGTLLMTRQDIDVFVLNSPIVGPGRVWKDNNNHQAGFVTLTGNNTHTGGTFIAGGGITVGNGGTDGWITGDVVFTNTPTAWDNARFLEFNRGDNVTFPGRITFSPTLALGVRGVLVQRGMGTLTLTGNNDYPGGTLVTNGASLRIGAGGTSGSIGTGPLHNDGWLYWNRSDNVTFGAAITGMGTVVQEGPGTLTLTASNNIFGFMTVSNGTLLLNSAQNFSAGFFAHGGALGGTGAADAPVTIDPGAALIPGGPAVGTFTINNDLNLAGNVAVDVNKSLAQSNDLVVVAGALNNTGTGTLTVSNLGPALAAGDTFTLFNQPVTGGAALAVTGAGATWQNNLAVDGSITALTVTVPMATTPTNITYTVSANQMTITWPASHLGWILQSQTNTLAVGLGVNWVDVPGSASVTNLSLPIHPGNPAVFYRLRRP